MDTSKAQKLSVSKAMRTILPLVAKAVPGCAVTYVFLAILHGSAQGIIAPVNQRLYDGLAGLVTGDSDLNTVFFGAALVTGAMLWQQVMNAAHNFFLTNVLTGKASMSLSQVIHSKMKVLPAQSFEDKDKLDDIEKAEQGKGGSIWLYATLNDVVFFYGSYYVIMGIFLWSIQPILLVALLMVFLPAMFAQVIEAKLHAKLEKVSAPIRRQHSHYEDCLIGSAKMKETRLFGAYHFFKGLYMDSLALLAQKEWDTQKKVAAMYFVINLFKAAGRLGVLALLFYQLLQGVISVGAFAAVFASVESMFSMVDEALTRVRRELTQNLGKVHNFINFLNLTPSPGENIQPNLSQGITVNDIRFTYPKAEKPAVDGVSLTIRPGETIALVGENGSGKTTLVKLLCGLYKPDSGRVEIGGQDTANTIDKALFSQTSAVFQDYSRYLLNLGDNTRISDTTSGDEPLQALIGADVNPNDKNTFPQGVETMLSREFDGVDLSGGQWQRVAMARGLYRSHGLIVLDEPTAAIDPIEETRVYKRFYGLAQEKIAILVTHRLGSARIADRILVMDAGKIVESGNHDELLANNGKYANMWGTQAEAYQGDLERRTYE